MEIRNLKYTNKNKSIDCEYSHPQFGWIPFTATENDVEKSGKEIYQKAINGEFGQISQYADTRTPEQIVIDEDYELALARKQSMLDGADYNGTVVSLTKDDGDGLVQVKSAFELGLTDTVIHFDNGAKLPMGVAEFPAFASWFVTERNKFFM